MEMETEQQPAQTLHEISQLKSIKKVLKKLDKLRIYLEKEYEIIRCSLQDYLQANIKTCHSILRNLIEIATKCKNDYHFGIEVFLYYTKKLLKTEIKSMKKLSKNYTVSLAENKKGSSYMELERALQALPYAKYSVQTATPISAQVQPSIYKDICDVLENYIEIGDALKDDDNIIEIKNSLSELKKTSFL